MKYKIEDVMGDGSCFFRSLYVVLKHKKIASRFIKQFANDFKLKGGEEEFVETMRKLLVNLIIQKKDWDIVHNVYQNLKLLKRTDYITIIQTSFPTWFVSSFSYLPKTEWDFRKKFAQGVLVKSHWVSEIEVAIVAKMISELKYNLQIFNKLPRKDFVFEPRGLYLLNRNEVHYNAIIVDNTKEKKEKKCNEGQILNPKTRRCVSQTSCKGYEVYYNIMMSKP
uniref:OTU domain-containing protein n=1 Tax=viral metagenome TaxID=1070528 RepID=A0A6C0BF96_9ZZZZ